MPLSSQILSRSPLSSRGTSGTISPSTPLFAAIFRKFSTPVKYTTLKYTINTIGTSDFSLINSTHLNTSFTFVPFWSALVYAFCITGPSARGSLKGTPISTIVAPSFSKDTIKSAVSSTVKSAPHVTKGIKAFLFSSFTLLNDKSILFIIFHLDMQAQHPYLYLLSLKY